MPARHLGAYTLRVDLLNELTDLLIKGPESDEAKLLGLSPNHNSALTQPPLAPVILDDHDLKPENYAELYALMPPQRTRPDIPKQMHWTPDLPRNADWASMYAVLSKFLGRFATPEKSAVNKAVWEKLKDLQKSNRNERRKMATLIRRAERKAANPVRKRVERAHPHFNASRIMDAVATLGLATLKERLATQSDPTRGKEADAGQGKNKPANTSRRNEVALPAVRGRARVRHKA